LSYGHVSALDADEKPCVPPKAHQVFGYDLAKLHAFRFPLRATPSAMRETHHIPAANVH
jgi:hypothetical protein